MALGAHWDDSGLTWDRADLAWDLPDTRLIIPYRFGPVSTPAEMTPWLDTDFAAITAAFTALPALPGLTVPYLFAEVGLQTPTLKLDANFRAVSDWITAAQSATFTIPYTFRVSAQLTPLARLDANFAALANWYNTHYGA